MSAKYFLDTNILIYSFDEKHPKKRARSRDLIEESLAKGSGVISWQVVQEFLNVALQKWERPLLIEDAREYMRSTLLPLCVVYPAREIWESALQIRTDSQYGLYDSLIIAAAHDSGAGILYSEDLQDGRQFGNLEIRNPFR